MGKHSEWRKTAKKERRRWCRRQKAAEKQKVEDEECKRRENSPSYKKWLEEQEQIEEFASNEESRLAEVADAEYLEREREACRHWQELQIKIRAAKEERAKQNAKIKEEWERDQQKLRELKEEKDRFEEEKRLKFERLQESIEEFINSEAEMPEELNEVLQSNPMKPVCPFFKKTAACRFSDNCSRNHIRPTVSNILIMRNFYSHYSLDLTSENEHGSDSILEFETQETYDHFKEFFYDILSELEKLGRLKQIKVCCNKEPHLRGNVYVEFAKAREAVKAYRNLQGRFYAGKQIAVEFCEIESWKSAICGLFFKQRCPKGSGCNFLHVFRNPGNMFFAASWEEPRSPNRKKVQDSDKREWRWSESPERPLRQEDKSKVDAVPNGSKEKYDRRRKRSRSRTKSRRRSRSRHVKNHRHRSRRSRS
ncbi:PREDICTED: U2 small nuclear ribonucleoprotein auxiliary factor 35 kDa subunit-related protein 2 [Nicrophorus vespilloides]|uniref:U2 small nuclear ribonucleoprotein auxiliary factor 35 kDa subunit-related protein 2 n=1 Tax=Nicrophorus vespilloides TaxID=110193 RepID=A0ABM1NBX4_NICVS|nr:PREDICTED: U2 small nuclear ribonucleoprotein auxiliary factor 35 kDa subunit-related protein 2 [Nicrophorus vespilloides]